MFPLLLLGVGVAAVLFLLPKKTPAAILQAGKEPPSLSDQLRSKAGTTLAGAGLTGVMAAGKAAISAIFSPAAIATVEVAPAVAATTATALAPVGVESAVAVGGAAAGAPVAYGAVATTGIIAAFAAPVILAMIFGAKAGARKAAAAQLASSNALQRLPDELAAIASTVETAVKAKDYAAFMNALPWGTIMEAASYGGGSTRGVDFTSFREANREAFTPILQIALMLAPATILEKLDAIGGSYPGGPPARVFPSMTEYPGLVLIRLHTEMQWPGTIDQLIKDSQALLAYVPEGGK